MRWFELLLHLAETDEAAFQAWMAALREQERKP